MSLTRLVHEFLEEDENFAVVVKDERIGPEPPSGRRETHQALRLRQ
jgi:hypothetical protein